MFNIEHNLRVCQQAALRDRELLGLYCAEFLRIRLAKAAYVAVRMRILV